MLEEPKRNLRVRKNPKYLNSDVSFHLIQQQDPDKLTFSHMKVPNDSTASYAQKAQDAKTLAKFINKINKNYRVYQNQLPSRTVLPQKNQIASKQKKVEVQSQTGKKANDQLKETKMQVTKKPKQITNNFKAPNIINSSQSIKQTQSMIKKLKQMSTIPSITTFGKGLCSDQLKKLQSLYPQMKNLSYESLTQHTNPNLFGGQSQLVDKKKVSPEVKTQKQMFPEEKLFKRSTYHVAIAYHIYLKNLKEKEGVIGNQIDPTYYARRLKEGKPFK